MNKPLIIQLIADYGVGDPAFAEVVQKLTYLDRKVVVNTVSVPKFSTVATGMWISQFATVNAFPGLIIYSNTAPRIKMTEANHQTLGGDFAYTRLNNGTVILAVHTGYCFSFIKNQMVNFKRVNVANSGSQFRSRDFYPDAVMGIAHGKKSFIGQDLPLISISKPPVNLIGFVDGYGNLKTTMRQSQCRISAGTRVKIKVNRVVREGVVADHTYKVKDGKISFAPGSTGGENRFMEIWVRGESAWEAFGEPKVESEFEIKSY